VNFLPVYLDSSAIVKLVVPEPETDALLEALGRWSDRVSVSMARVEVHRALRRTGRPRSAHARADAVLEGLVLLRVDDPLLDRAAALKNRQLRTLDAMHLAASLAIGDAPDAFITYDARLARAARRERLNVLHPGAAGLG